MFNASRCSLASVGSSYHSWEEPEIGSLQNLYDYEDSQLRNTANSEPTFVGSSDDSEEIVLKYAGHTRYDIATIHTKLVDMAVQLHTQAARTALSSTTTVVANTTGPESISDVSTDGQADTVVSILKPCCMVYLLTIVSL